MISKVLFSSARDDWETPQEFFKALDDEFHFTLDPCADDHNHKCERYFTIEQDGLSQSWAGETVFCNPPYGRAISRWVEKAYTEAAVNGALVVMLIPARTDTNTFHDYIYNRAEIRFVRGRLHFSGADRSPFPSMIVIYRPAGKPKKQYKI